MGPGQTGTARLPKKGRATTALSRKATFRKGAVVMFYPKSRAPLVAFSLALISILLQGCLGSIAYRTNPEIQTGLHTEIVNFSDRDLNPERVDDLYLEVAHLMRITPNSSRPRPKILVVSPSEIHQRYLSLRPSAKTQDGIAVGLFIPHENKILISHFDRIILSHELAHFFTFQYLSAPRSKWEQIAEQVTDKIRNNGRIVR
jgi:hypothetical protein